jgi:hypothetical protein
VSDAPLGWHHAGSQHNVPVFFGSSGTVHATMGRRTEDRFRGLIIDYLFLSHPINKLRPQEPTGNGLGKWNMEVTGSERMDQKQAHRRASDCPST